MRTSSKQSEHPYIDRYCGGRLPRAGHAPDQIWRVRVPSSGPPQNLPLSSALARWSTKPTIITGIWKFCRILQELVQFFWQQNNTSKVMLGPHHNRNTYSRPRKVFRSCSLCKGHFTIWSRQYPEKTEIGFSVVTGLQVSCKDVQDRALNQMLIHYHSIHVGPSTPWAKINQVL